MSHLIEMSNITTRANNQFPRPDFHRLDKQPYRLQPLDKGGLQAGWVIATRKVPPDVLCVRRGKTLLLKEQPCAS
jgi:hypothetical protein